jgi:hypothetical protein
MSALKKLLSRIFRSIRVRLWASLAAVCVVVLAITFAFAPTRRGFVADRVSGSASESPSSSPTPSQAGVSRTPTPTPDTAEASPSPTEDPNAHATKLSGFVRSSDGQSIEGICVSADEQDQGGSNYDRQNLVVGRSGADGAYEVTLPAYQHVVEFWDCRPDAVFAPYIVPGGNLEPYKPEGNIDVALSPGGVITGAVVEPSGSPLAGTCVDLFDGRYLIEGDYISILTARTGPDGTYRFGGLAPSEKYMVLFGDCAPRIYFPHWYRGKDFSVFDGDPREWQVQDDVTDWGTYVAVVSTTTTAGINAQLHQAGALSGSVENVSGVALSKFCFIVFITGEGRTTLTGGEGATTYEVRKLPAGTYVVQFARVLCHSGGEPSTADGRDADEGYGPQEIQYYNRQTSADAADKVQIIAGQTTNGIDGSL